MRLKDGQMENKSTALGILGVFVSLCLLAACSPSTPTSTPTLDLDPIRTEVAATVLAQVSQTLALTQSVTPSPSPTMTLTPTRDLVPELSPSPSLQITLVAGTPVTSTIDQAQWVSQTIQDETVFAPGETFTMTWRLKNVGTSTWTAAYLLRFYSGDDLGAPEEIPLGQVVAPNAEVDISLQMTAPAIEGDYRSDWVLSNESRSNFNDPIFLKITVAIPRTPSPIVSSTPQP